MQPTTAQPTRLLPRQTRLVNARAGMRLRVVAGRLWLTQPNAAQDLFLGPGDTIDLLQDWVVIGADAPISARAAGTPGHAEYLLQPLVEPVPRRRWGATLWQILGRTARRWGLMEVAARWRAMAR